MSLSDEIKKAIAPYIGKNASPFNRSELEAVILATARQYQPNISAIELEVIRFSAQVYITVKIMVDNYQQQIDQISTQIQTLQGQVTGLESAVDNLTIGSDVQAWDIALQQLSELILGSNQFLGTNSNGQITQYNVQRRAAGMVMLLPYDPLTIAGWTVNGAVYTDPDSWLWYLPGGVGLSNSNPKFLELFVALWGTAAYTITGGKGINALSDWNAGKTLIVPDFRGRVIGTAGTATGGIIPRVVGSVWGAEAASLAIANLPAHRHNISIAGFTATGLASNGATGIGAMTYGNNSIALNQAGIAGNRSAASDGLGAIGDTGSGTAFNIADSGKTYTELWWMNTK
jgi:hypothetical protein